MNQTILVTGGTGFIGSHTTVELQEAGYDVVIVDNLSNSKIEVLDGIEKITGKRPAFEQVDCCDFSALEAVFAKYPSICGIIHFAASKAVGESVEKPLLYYRNNLNSLINLLELMPKYDVKGIIFSSSCTVYGQPTKENLPVTEEAPIQKALSPYGNTKQINEEIIQDYIHSGAPIKSVILRYFNPIGAHPSALIGELPLGVPMNLIPFVTQTAIGIRKELKVFGNDYDTPDGTCIRDYIYVVDLAKAHVAAMTRVLEQETDPVEIFNIGTGRGLSTLEVVQGFEKATGVKLNWTFAPRREGDIEKVWGNVDKANKVLGWKADTPIEDVLASAWKWQEKLRDDGVM
ncbi:MAG: UDP-glucose 4-epimerase GalE [Prevotella sp.]|nr:UDP-glucose 4-epimerase GalE [Prevotella sp.]